MSTPAVERTRPPLAGDERALLAAFLDFHRATPRTRCDGLSPATGLPQLIVPTRIVAHLRWLEYFWCEVVLAGRHGKAPYTEDDPATDFKVPDDTPLELVLDEYERQCRNSREVLAGLDLDHEVRWHGRNTSVRWVFLHLIEETARHNGQLDAVRELLNSATGE